MKVVIDASITLDLFTSIPNSLAHQRALALFDDIAENRVDACVPTHYSIEVASAAVRFQRRNAERVTQKKLLQYLERLETFAIEHCSFIVNPALVGGWAIAMNCSGYDAVYIHLARKLGAALASSDKAQLAAARNLKIPLWEPVARDAA